MATTYTQSGSGASLSADQVKSGSFSPGTFFIESGTGRKVTSADLSAPTTPTPPSTPPPAAPGATPTTAPSPATTPQQATSSSTQLRASLDGTSPVDPSQASMMTFDQFKASITPTNPPPPVPNTSQQYSDLRASQGVQPLEDQYTALDSQIAALQDKLEANTNTRVEGETQSFVTGQANTENASIQMQIDSLTRKQGVINDQIKFKNDFISQTMNFTQTDYSNTLSAWNTSFNQAMSVQSAFDTYQNKVITEEQREMTNARGTLTAMTNMMANNGQDINDILSANPGFGNQIAALEMRAGYPPGFVQTFAAVKPRANIVSSSETVDNGQKYLDVITVEPGGGYGHTRVYEGPATSLSGGAGKTIGTLSDGTTVSANDVADTRQQIMAVNGADRLTNYMAAYNYMVSDGGMSATTFFSQFPVKDMLAPDTPDDPSIVDTVARYPDSIVEQYSAGMKTAVAALQQRNATVIDNPDYK